MDLNYIHFRQQTELMRASLAACAPSRLAHEELASAYSRIIAAHIARHRAVETA